MKKNILWPNNLIEEITREYNDIDYIVSKELIVEIDVIISNLPVRTQRLLYYRFKNGMTYAELGKELNTTAENCRQILIKTLRILRSSNNDCRFIDLVCSTRDYRYCRIINDYMNIELTRLNNVRTSGKISKCLYNYRFQSAIRSITLYLLGKNKIEFKYNSKTSELIYKMYKTCDNIPRELVDNSTTIDMWNEINMNNRRSINRYKDEFLDDNILNSVIIGYTKLLELSKE